MDWLQRTIRIEGLAHVQEGQPGQLLQHTVLGDLRPLLAVLHAFGDGGGNFRFSQVLLTD
ncbi:hypothetical protein D9M72_593880 [compost metagenome]